MADELRAGVVFLAGVAEFEDPGAGVFALGVAAHGAAAPGVVHDNDVILRRRSSSSQWESGS